MDFQERLRQRVAEAEEGNGQNRKQVDYPSKSLKNPELYFNNAENKDLYLRILPPANLQDDYAVPYRKIYLAARNQNGKDLKTDFILPAQPNPESRLEQSLVTWHAQKRVPNPFGADAKPGSKYKANVVRVITNQQTGNWEEERDTNGQLVVRTLELPQTAYQAINSALIDPMLRPMGNQSPYSFISPESAFLIKLTKPAKGKMTYDLQVYTNFPLGALPQGWENLLEDLNYQVTPTEVFDPDYVNYFIDVVEGVENRGEGNQVAPQGVAPQQQVPVQPQFQQPVTPQQGYQQGFQQPVTPQQGYQQGFQQPVTPQYNQAPQQGYQAPVTPQQPVYQAPVAPVTLDKPQQQQQQQPQYQAPVTPQALVTPVPQPVTPQYQTPATPAPAPVQQPVDLPGTDDPFAQNAIPNLPVSAPTVDDTTLPSNLVNAPNAGTVAPNTAPSAELPSVDDLLGSMGVEV